MTTYDVFDRMKISIVVMTTVALAIALITNSKNTIPFEISFGNALIQAVILTFIALFGTLLVLLSKMRQNELKDQVRDLKLQLENTKKIVKKSKSKDVFESNLKKQLYVDDSRMNIVKLSILIELELQRIVKRRNLKHTNLTFSSMTNELVKHNVVDGMTKEILLMTAQIRNKAVHGGSITESDYKAFLELSDYVLFALKSK